jgi:hypothetical protein
VSAAAESCGPSDMLEDRLPAVTAGQLLKLFAPRKRGTLRASLFAQRDPLAPRWRRDRATYRMRVTHELRDGVREDSTVEVRGWVGNGYLDGTTRVPSSGPFSGYARYSSEPENVYEPTSGSWIFVEDRLRDVLAVLPRDAEVEFRTVLDNYDAGPLAERGVHHDRLVLRARWTRGRKAFDREYQVAESVGPHDTARFGVRW